MVTQSVLVDQTENGRDYRYHVNVSYTISYNYKFYCGNKSIVTDYAKLKSIFKNLYTFVTNDTIISIVSKRTLNKHEYNN